MLRVSVGYLLAEGSRQARFEAPDPLLAWCLAASISTLSDAALSAVWPLSP